MLGLVHFEQSQSLEDGKVPSLSPPYQKKGGGGGERRRRAVVIRIYRRDPAKKKSKLQYPNGDEEAGGRGRLDVELATRGEPLSVHCLGV